MKDVLSDVLRQVAPLFEKIRVIGTETSTKVEAYTEDKMLFLFGEFKVPVVPLAGEFGLNNLQLLRGLLEHASYKADSAQFEVHRVTRDSVDYVAEFEFKDAGGGRTRFKTINPRMLGDRAHFTAPSWTVQVTPTKAKLTDAMQLSSMLSTVEQNFSVSCENRTLFLNIGGKGAANHNGAVALANDVECASLPTTMVYRVQHFLNVLKNAGNMPSTIRFAKEGVTGIMVETEHCNYSYILRGTEDTK